MPAHIQELREMLARDRGVLLPGAPNALAARVIADLGFKAVYLTGAGLTNMHLGLPDFGLYGLKPGGGPHHGDTGRGRPAADCRC
jgi:2-methylisocitrate lyase-like PEP mutase family enzyme